MPPFNLVVPDGEVLGLMELGRPDWPLGSIVYTGAGRPNLRVIDRLDADDDPEGFACLVVEEVPPDEASREAARCAATRAASRTRPATAGR